MKLCRIIIFMLFVNGQVLMIHLGWVVSLTRHSVVLTLYVMTHPGTLFGMAYTTPKQTTNMLPKWLSMGPCLISYSNFRGLF